MKQIKKYLKIHLEDLFLNTTNRLCIQLRLFCIASFLITIIMTILNFFNKEYILGLETALGAIASAFIYTYVARTKKYLPGSICFTIIYLGLLTVFVLSGAVEGFAALWFCLYPFICLFILDIKRAILFVIIGLLFLILLLWTPLSQILPPVYTHNFLLRFPFLYIGNFAFSLALNGFYSYTYNRLLQMNQKFELLSNQDGLTELANRNCLKRYMENLLSRKPIEVSSVILDVDYFKQYNDTYGHLAGDDVLKAIAQQISKLLPDTDSIAVRYGGEEFLILFPGYSFEKTALFAKTLLNAVYNLRIPHSAIDSYVSISIGISSRVVNTEKDFSILFKQSDDKLYLAKQKGRNCISY